MTQTQDHHTLSSFTTAGTVAGLLTAMLLGTLDGVWLTFHADTAHGWRAVAFSIGLHLPMAMVLGIGLGIVQGALPIHTGPQALRRLGAALLTRDPSSRARIAAGLWSGGLGLVVAYGGMFKLNHLFMVTFQNKTLSSLVLAGVTLVGLAALTGATLWLAFAWTRLLSRPQLASLASPLLPIGLAVTAAITGAILVPIRTHETWQQLDLRAPTAILVLCMLLIAFTGALEGVFRSRTRLGWGLAALACATGLGGFGATAASFGASSEDSALGYAMEEEGLLTRVLLPQARRLFDADRDGFAARLAGGDCDDADPGINPAADEVMDNGVDENCDGSDLTRMVGETPSEETPSVQEPPDEPDGPTWRRRPTNVLWIMVDTLRPDHTGWGGYTRDTTPNTDAIAKRATVFENAYSLASITSMVIGPVMASRYPSEMKRRYTHFIPYHDDNLLIGEVMRDRGYLTAGSGAHDYLKRTSGLAQGFVRWRTFTPPGGVHMDTLASSKEVTDAAILHLKHLSRGELSPKGPEDADMPETVEQALPERPWFLYVHYLDPHKAYLKHEGFDFGQSTVDRYDGEIAFMDHHMGRLFEALEEADPGLMNTIIVLTSDHGEGLGERGIKFHGVGLYENQIRVALFMYVPGAEPRRLTTPVSLIDVAPTLLDATATPIPDTFRGVSLLPQIVDGTPLKGRPIYAEMPPGPRTSRARSFMMDGLKLMHSPKSNFYRLFEPSNDPMERRSLWNKRPQEAERMKQAYQRFRATVLEPVEARGAP